MPETPPLNARSERQPRVTHTRTFTRKTFANPHLRCDECGARVEGCRMVRNGDGEEVPGPFIPCGHTGSYTDLCPSWSPVDGCTCPEPHVVVQGQNREATS